MIQGIYGYLRVSSIDQNEDRQRIDLEKWGIPPENLYCDKVSGKDFNRPQYKKLIRKLKPGDLFVVKSIDRLGRNYKEIQEEWRYITHTKKTDIVIIDMPLLDTRTRKDLIGTLISDIVLQLLSYVAETERINIRQRQAEGIAAAKKRGGHMGRKADAIPESFPHFYEQWLHKELLPSQFQDVTGLTVNQFYWMVKKYRNYLNSHPDKNL